MPTFEIALDDGRKFHVEAESQDAALAGIQQHVGAPKQGGGIVDAARAGASDFVTGLGETASRNLGLDGVGEALKSAGEKIAPAQRPNSTLYDEQGFHAGNIPAALAEASPSTAAAISAARLMPGPIWAKLAAGGAVGLGSMLGLYTQQATEKRTGDKNAPSSQEDVIEGLKRAAPEAAVQALPLGRFVPGQAARLGLKGVVGSLGRTAADAAAMGAGGAGAQAYDQIYQGGDFDPNKVIDAASRNALVGGALGAKRTLGDVKAAIKYRGIADEDPSHISEASNRIFQSADNLGVNLRSPKGGGQAIESARSDVETEFKNAVDRIKGSGEDKNVLSPEAQNALARAQRGLPLSDADTAVLTAASGDEGAVADLSRLGGVSRVLEGVKGTGHFDATTGKLTGGISGAMEHHVRALTNPLGAAASVGLAGLGGAHLGDAFAHSPEALATLGGAYGLARLNDWASGARSPANAFASRFADPSVGVPNASQPPVSGLAALDRMATNPTGPRIGMAPTPWGTEAPNVPPARPSVNPTGPSVPQAPTPWGPTPPAVDQPQAMSLLRALAARQKMGDKAMPLLQKLAAQNAPQPEAPPQLPQFNPIALKMMREGLANPPQAPAPEAPQQPQLNPIAMKMLLQKLKSPPQAPQAQAAAAVPPAKITKTNGKVKAVAAPDTNGTQPQINFDPKTVSEGNIPLRPEQRVMNVDPKALDAAFKATNPEFYDNLIPGRMDRLKAHVANGNPVSLPEVGAVNGQIGFTNGRTRARLAAQMGLKQIPVAVDKGNEQAVQDLVNKHGKGLEIPEDLSIPDFLKRLPQPVSEPAAPEQPQPVVAQKALAKLNGPRKYVPVPAHEMKPANVLAMSDADYAEHKMAQYEPGFLHNPTAYRAATMVNRAWKRDVSTKLAKLFPEVGNKDWFFGELESTNQRAPIRQLRDYLASLDKRKSADVHELLSETQLARVWSRTVGKPR